MSQVSAKVIAHSKNKETGKEIITYELEYPRLILAEVNTHRALSKNTSSSRAIPVSKINQMVWDNPAMPVRFGKHNKGMQDAGEHNELVTVHSDAEAMTPDEAWTWAAQQATVVSEAFEHAGYAKQVCNRLTEPFQRVRQVVTATEWNNFFWLRNHEAADPTFDALAEEMLKAKEKSTPVLLDKGEWHMPYFEDGYWKEDCGVPLQDALDISASCCAQVSFRALDDTLEKARSVVEKLNLRGQNGEPVHASPVEHQATPIFSVHDEGVTHLAMDGGIWSANFKDWAQHRQMIPNHYKKD